MLRLKAVTNSDGDLDITGALSEHIAFLVPEIKPWYCVLVAHKGEGCKDDSVGNDPNQDCPTWPDPPSSTMACTPTFPGLAWGHSYSFFLQQRFPLARCHVGTE
jgi:hypothetical protein